MVQGREKCKLFPVSTFIYLPSNDVFEVTMINKHLKQYFHRILRGEVVDSAFSLRSTFGVLENVSIV